MKKLWVAGAVLFSALSLSACAGKESDAAKQAFIDTTFEMSSKDYNTSEIKLNVDDFKATGEGASEINQVLKDAQFSMATTLDEKNKLADLAGVVNVEGKDYKLNLMMSQKGIYINSTDVKSIYNGAKPSLPADAQAGLPMFDAMVGALSTPYFLIDRKMMDAGLQDSDLTWAQTVDEMFNKKQLSKEDLAKAYKDIEDKAFTQKGDNITLQISDKDTDFTKLVKSMAAANQAIPEEQLDQIFEEGKDEIKALNLKMTVNQKTHVMKSVVEGRTDDKEGSTADFKISFSSKVSKNNKALKEPASSEVKTLPELQQAAVESFMAAQ